MFINPNYDCMKTKNIIVILILFVNYSCGKSTIPDPILPVEPSTLFSGLHTIDTIFPLIPQPIKISAYNAFCDIKSLKVIYISNENLRPAANYLSAVLSDIRSERLDILVGNSRTKNALNLITEPLSDNSEEYKLDIAPDNFTIIGTTPQAVTCGINTFRQFVAINSVLSSSSNSYFPCVAIEDKPVFHWRSFMLDVARHFFTKEEICQTMDMMALLKLNKLHLHLTDDEGWRIPIDKYPEFLETGWKRLPNDQDSFCLEMAKSYPDYKFPSDRWDGTSYFGKFSKTEIKEMIDYGLERGIEIIPEIDVPGHSTIAIKAHNNFACVGKNVGWGKEFSYPLCLGNDSVLNYYTDIFNEIMELFPSKYIHVGADEADPTNWISCPKCQARISTNNLISIPGLERWFLNKIEKNIREKGRKMIVWDDALGMVSSSASIMWWRDWIGMDNAVGGAVRQGSEAVIANWDILYFSANEKNTSLSEIYHLPLYPQGISDGQKNLIIGIQACVFTESIPNVGRLNFMIYPRMFALSEKAWYADKTSDETWNSFKNRLNTWLRYLQLKNIRYHTPSY